VYDDGMGRECGVLVADVGEELGLRRLTFSISMKRTDLLRGLRPLFYFVFTPIHSQGSRSRAPVAAMRSKTRPTRSAGRSGVTRAQTSAYYDVVALGCWAGGDLAVGSRSLPLPPANR